MHEPSSEGWDLRDKGRKVLEISLLLEMCHSASESRLQSEQDCETTCRSKWECRPTSCLNVNNPLTNTRKFEIHDGKKAVNKENSVKCSKICPRAALTGLIVFWLHSSCSGPIQTVILFLYPWGGEPVKCPLWPTAPPSGWVNRINRQNRGRCHQKWRCGPQTKRIEVHSRYWILQNENV